MSMLTWWCFSAVFNIDKGALKQLTGLVVRVVEVLTINALFHILAIIFFLSLLLMPWFRKVAVDANEAGDI